MKTNIYKGIRWERKRLKILRRDGYVCRQCKRFGKTTPATTVHHVFPVEERVDLTFVNDNLISLCNVCHDSMHDRRSRKLTKLGMEWVERVAPLLEHLKTST